MDFLAQADELLDQLLRADGIVVVRRDVVAEKLKQVFDEGRRQTAYEKSRLSVQAECVYTRLDPSPY